MRIWYRRLADYKSPGRDLSKKIRVLLAVAIVLALSAAWARVEQPASASQHQAPNVASTSAKNSAIVATTQAVLKETSAIRELSILRPVKSGAQSRAEIERMVIRNLDEEATPEDMHAGELELKKLGLAPPDFQYRDFTIRLLSEQVAGYYEPKLQEFFLADWIDLEAQKPVMAHELTHALQDQHFNLRRFEHWPKGDSDAELAAHSLVEGDATLAMTIYMARYPLVALSFVRSLGSASAQSEQFNQAPRKVRETLVFPYQQGSEWATQLYKRGGWNAVSQAFTALPQSTEQILHPEKYFAHEAPVKVNIPDVARQLGPKWKRLDYDVNGEWNYYLILDQFLNAPAESKRAAAGWGGDRFALYEGPTAKDVAITNLSAWDTENDAREFYDAYTKRTLARYAKEDLSEIEAPAEGSSRAWNTSEGGVVIEIRGKQVMIIEGLPAAVDAKSVLRTLWNGA
jgi:hypothetical protein